MRSRLGRVARVLSGVGGVGLFVGVVWGIVCVCQSVRDESRYSLWMNRAMLGIMVEVTGGAMLLGLTIVADRLEGR